MSETDFHNTFIVKREKSFDDIEGAFGIYQENGS
jgi:hypothetical protein